MDKSEIEAERRHFVDATRQANYSFWSALLTVNGIFISVFVAAIFVVESDRRIMAILVVVSMQSCLLLIRSIRALRDFYEGLGPYVEGKAPTVDEERENYETVNKLRKSLKWCKWS